MLIVYILQKEENRKRKGMQSSSFIYTYNEFVYVINDLLNIKKIVIFFKDCLCDMFLKTRLSYPLLLTYLSV